MSLPAKQSSGVPLERLLSGFVSAAGAPLAVTGVCMDSRLVQAGDLFLACQGVDHHGLKFLNEAIARGASAVAWEPAPQVSPANTLGIPTFAVPDLRARAGEIAARFYGDPSATLSVVGVTGTNGKTSVSHYVAQSFSEGGQSCGLMGTVGSGVYGRTRRSSQTTPGPVDIQRCLAEICDAGAQRAVMEVSSHALDQGRVNGVRFNTAVFTNLSHDHLDYHGSMARYAQAKRRLFDIEGLRKAVINSDDETGRLWLRELSGRLETLAYSVLPGNPYRAAVWADNVVETRAGLRFDLHTPWGQSAIDSRLIGSFNVENLLATAAVLGLFDFSLEQIRNALQRIKPVPGRMEAFGGGRQPLVVVDYAHTPDALGKALTALRNHTQGKLICVFGCGGDRDAHKRPAMGAMVEQRADLGIITDDNPRSERPTDIVADIRSGLTLPEAMPVLHDRLAAIQAALQLAGGQDCVLIAGKGHEDYQVIGTERYHFSDREAVRRLLQEAQA